MLLGVYAYFIEHSSATPLSGCRRMVMPRTLWKSRWADHPWYSFAACAGPVVCKKHRDNTLTMKRFTNGRGFCAWAVKRQKTTVKSRWMWRVWWTCCFWWWYWTGRLSDVPGDKRIEGSVWPKSIRGSTPKGEAPARLSVQPVNPRILCVFCCLPALRGGAVP